VLYVGSQLFSFLLSANPTMDKTQRTILMALPFFFIAIAWQLPAGLLVYWITTNTWTNAQSAIVRKRLGHLRQAAQDAQAEVGGRGGLGDLFKQQRAEPPPWGRRPRTSDDSTTKIPTGSGEHRSKAGSRPPGWQRRASGAPPAPRRHKKKRSARRR
jgi:YidC/Oxa1 family membrane protein insertase